MYVKVGEQGQLARDSVAYVGNKLLVFGGGDGRKATNETLLIDVPTLATVRLEVRGYQLKGLCNLQLAEVLKTPVHSLAGTRSAASGARGACDGSHTWFIGVRSAQLY